MARIVYLSWPATEIAGGIKAAFQHVELLREAGLEAAVATEDAAPPHWFASPAPMLTFDDVQSGDVLVFPENHEGLLKRFGPAGHRKLVFCQSMLQAWRGLAGHASYAQFGITHVLCPSATVLQFCRRRLPDLKLAYTPFFVDHDRFTCPGVKRLQIACAPRKRPMEAMFIRDLLCASHPEFSQLEWILIQDANEAQVAQAMGQAAVFLSLARLEAHCMTSLEAMACGCIVAGFSGNAGHNDSATAANGFWAPEDDLMACTDQLAQAVGLAAGAGAAYQAMVAQARQTAHAYRRQEAARLVLAAWQAILSEPAR